MTKFDWYATESAPRNYPMEIVSGFLFAEDGSSLYIPYGAPIDHGWGEMASSHVVGPDLKSLPNHLDIAFYSYTEDVFYQGSFDLPYERILRLFQQEYSKPLNEQKLRYGSIMVGVAPGGVVSVWLLGPSRITEVFYGRASQAEIAWETVLDNPTIPRETHRSLVLQESLGEAGLARLEKEGIPFGLWDSYRVPHLWRLRVHSEKAAIMPTFIIFWNGSKHHHDFTLPEDGIWTKKLPIPKTIYVRWPKEAGKTHVIYLHFDEQEITAAFKLLLGEPSEHPGRLAHLEVYMQEEGKKRTVSAGLRSGDEFIVFEKMEVEAFRVLSKNQRKY